MPIFSKMNLRTLLIDAAPRGARGSLRNVNLRIHVPGRRWRMALSMLLLVAIEQKLPAGTVSLTNAAMPSLFQRLLVTTPAIAASVTTTTVGATANVPARIYTWQDEDGETRSALMLDQSVARAGVLRQISYRVAGTDRVCSAI